MEITAIRKRLVKRILAKQDEHFRWGFDEKLAQERPEYLHYWPKYKSTLWALLLLADLRAPVDIPQLEPSIQLITERFYEPEPGVFRLPDGHTPIKRFMSVPVIEDGKVRIIFGVGNKAGEYDENGARYKIAYQCLHRLGFQTAKTR